MNNLTPQTLSGSGWYLSGWIPYYWQFHKPTEVAVRTEADITEMPASIPCSVQFVLRENGLIPDWNIGQNARACEWVEHRHWIFRREIDLAEGDFDLVCEGLDFNGWLLWDGNILAEFLGSNFPHRFELPREAGHHTIAIVFDLPPRWLGQFGDTRELSVGKPRYYYTWDWTVRMVQTGITGDISIVPRNMADIHIQSFDTELNTFSIRGELKCCQPDSRISLQLTDADGNDCFSADISCDEFSRGFTSPALAVLPWQPNGTGAAVLYKLTVSVQGGPRKTFNIGFRQIHRLPCQDAPVGADNWLFEVNGKPLFIQGINWTPVLPNYADATEKTYRRLIASYKDLGVNMFRVWGGASREKPIFYDLCDENGIMVWQEFPLSSSGVCNLPPDRPDCLDLLSKTADAYLDSLILHPCLTVWSGGNELSKKLQNGKDVPCAGDEPALVLIAAKIQERDAARIFVPTSPSGPTGFCDEHDYGKGIHYDTHGPWKPADTPISQDWARYWQHDDALFRSEFGAPGAASTDMIRKYAGNLHELPIASVNPLWHTPNTWWLEDNAFRMQFGRVPATLEEYVEWSQARQAEALTIAISCAKNRYPRCGGVILWMGHDSFPCPANTSIIDFEGHLKPAALAVKKLFTEKA